MEIRHSQQVIVKTVSENHRYIAAGCPLAKVRKEQNTGYHTDREVLLVEYHEIRHVFYKRNSIYINRCSNSTMYMYMHEHKA